jgi:hypothetical protein
MKTVTHIVSTFAVRSETLDVFGEIADERASQDMKWGEQNHGSDRWLTVLMEEVGEMSKENLEGRPDRYRAELVQVAAVAVAMLEAFDRNGL